MTTISKTPFIVVASISTIAIIPSLSASVTLILVFGATSLPMIASSRTTQLAKDRALVYSVKLVLDRPTLHLSIVSKSPIPILVVESDKLIDQMVVEPSV